MTAGIKTFNNCVNVDYAGVKVATIAHEVAASRAIAVGAVRSVPISHATPAASYSHNVHRDDYQDLTRDLLGLKSISHPETPLPGLDVVIGGGSVTSSRQRREERPAILTPRERTSFPATVSDDADRRGRRRRQRRQVRRRRADRRPRTAPSCLKEAAEKAVARQSSAVRRSSASEKRKGHLPFRTADGDFDPCRAGRRASRPTRPTMLPRIRRSST